MPRSNDPRRARCRGGRILRAALLLAAVGLARHADAGDARGSGRAVTTVGAAISGLRAMVVDPRDPTRLYVGTSECSGVVRSTDGGRTWEAASTGLPRDGAVYVLAADPATSRTLYAGLFDEGVFKSIDGGSTWNAARTGLPRGGYVRALVIDPMTPGTLYAAQSAGGVFKSTDAGAAWGAVNAGLADRDVTALAIDPTTPATLYATTANARVFKSLDGGGTWSAAGTLHPNFSCGGPCMMPLVIDPLAPGTL